MIQVSLQYTFKGYQLMALAAKLKIRLPAKVRQDTAQPSQWQRVRKDTSEESEPGPLKTKTMLKCKKRRRPDANSDSLSSSDSSDGCDELPTPLPRKATLSQYSACLSHDMMSPHKRGRGRPQKSADNQPHPHNHFSIPVFVEIAVPPKFWPGKTPRGNKLEKQEPRDRTLGRPGVASLMVMLSSAETGTWSTIRRSLIWIDLVL